MQILKLDFASPRLDFGKSKSFCQVPLQPQTSNVDNETFFFNREHFPVPRTKPVFLEALRILLVLAPPCGFPELCFQWPPNNIATKGGREKWSTAGVVKRETRSETGRSCILPMERQVSDSGLRNHFLHWLWGVFEF